MKVNYKYLMLLAILLNVISITTAQADEEIDAEFLEFLVDMEETTGSGFDQWLEDNSVDTEEPDTNTEAVNVESNEK